MNEFLSVWLHDAVCACAGEEVVDRNDEECCVELGKFLLNLPCGATLVDICHSLSEMYSINLESSNPVEIAEYLLVYAVTESGESAFVEAIMGYQVDAQVYLKSIIEGKMSGSEENANDSAEEEEECDEPIIEFKVEDISVKPVCAPAHKDTHSAFTVSPECTSCMEKDSLVKRMQQELSQSTKKFQEEINKLKEENGVVMNKNVDMEIQIMQKESAIFEKDQALQDFITQKEKLETVLARNNKLEEQVLVLQDKIDLLEDQAAKLDSAEAQVEKFRAKLDELTDVKLQLKQESANHTETFQKLTALEQEVEGLRKLKPQVDEYRAQFAETSIEMQELQLRLDTSEGLVEHLKNENAALRGDQSDTRQQTQHLADQLRTTAEQLRERERTNGIGEGMSELNPALMQELTRLRNENKELLEKIDAAQQSQLDILRKDSADLKCTNASLLKKLCTTKDALEQATKDNQSLTVCLCEKEHYLATLKAQLEEAAVMHTEDVAARRRVHSQQKSFLQKKHSDALALAHLGHTTVCSIFSESLKQAHTTLEATQQEVQESHALQQKTADELTATQEALQEAGRKRKHLEVEHEEAVQHLRCEFDNTLEEHAKRHKVDLSELETKMNLAIAAEKERTSALEAQVEQDLVRMRKLNNLKRIQEQEVVRLKTQLRSAVSSDAVGEGVSEAMSELKSMEQQLKDAHAEISLLRSRVTSVSDGQSAGIICQSSAPSSALGAPVRVSAPVDHALGSAGEPTFGSLSYAGYLEQADYTEKRIKQLSDEKRGLIAKGLEEMREKNELLQKLLAIEKEHAELKNEKRKIELENRRMDAKLEKLMSAQNNLTNSNKENIVN